MKQTDISNFFFLDSRKKKKKRKYFVTNLCKLGGKCFILINCILSINNRLICLGIEVVN